MQVSVKITGTDTEIARLRKLGDKLTDFSSALKTIGHELTTYYASKPFASKGGIFDQVWADLNPIYAKRKGKVWGYGRPVLYASGEMSKSFYAESTRDTLEIGNTAPQFVYHQSSAPRSKMPYRPMMGINADIKSIVNQVLQNDVAQKLGSV